MSDLKHLIDGYLDDTLSAREHEELSLWLKQTPENARQFAQRTFLHDRLRDEHLALAALKGDSQTELHGLVLPRRSRALTVAGAAIAAAILVAVVWKGVGETPAAAAATEVQRIMAANAQPKDRTYRIAVEETALSANRGEQRGPSQDNRPPKPPLDGAVLHVRGNRQFVLVRQTPEGAPFITGSDGRTSWAVRPDGPVRVSSDLNRFNRDVPGHEHAMPLSNIQEGLQRLLEAYRLQLLPMEERDEASGDEPSRLMVAVKKPGNRGPKRVEITYATATGLIQQIRFIDMPYGPQRLTLRMTLAAERDLGADFFDHKSHHDPQRPVEFED